MHSFYCQNIPAGGEYIRLNERDEKHLFKTLRGKAGETVELQDGNGVIALAEINSDRRLLITDRNTVAEPRVKLHLAVAPPRRNQMEQLLRQCAEVGIWSITPVITERSVAVPSQESTSERWELILREGCKQSRNPFVPRLNHSLKFSEVLDMCHGRQAYFGSPYVEGISPAPSSDDIIWLVGPEGGFSPGEEERLHQSGVIPYRIGDRIMRVETAAICGAAILLFQARTDL